MAAFVSKLLTFGNDKFLKPYLGLVDAINAAEPALQEKTDEELRSIADALRERAVAGEPQKNLIVESFSLIREASRRTTGLRHYDVQLIGGLALNGGCIAEMKTGEGKTLVSTAACFLNALDGSNTHVVTVNDYLAKRDAEYTGRIYRFLGMDTGVILNEMPPMRRRASYAANVTYGTNSEFGFDYLRDNMVSSAADRVQRGHTFAVVDEVDSILIDEARTPLIISGLGAAAADDYLRFAKIMPLLKADEDYIYDEKKRTIYATERGLDKVERELGFEVYADISGRLANHLKQALKAQFTMKRDIDYVVANGEVKIVDEFTGRIMEGRRWSEGLHQAVEAKEGVEIKPESQTLATITLQNYFRLYEKLSGMTGTALTEDSEFRQIYNLPVIPIPTNKPVIRKDQDDYIFRTEKAKFSAVAREVETRHAKGQPVLVGTTSIDASERLSAILDKRGIEHEVLNAKNPEREASIVAQAGRVGAVTIATNMAGRGTDILLGGSEEQLKREWLLKLGADPENPVEWQVESAQQYADHTIKSEGYAVRVLGGLYVIGTERHESRRIDNQLRGRSGRQGDPGESRFFLSLEDNLLRRFGGDRLKAVSAMMEKQGSDDIPLQDSLVTKVIDTAQHQVESIHFDSRKQVLQYDDVMNLQRKAIYKERNAILDGKDVCDLLPDIIDATLERAVEPACPAALPIDDWDTDDLNAWTADIAGRSDFDIADHLGEDPENDEVYEALSDLFAEIVQEKRDALGEEKFRSLCNQIMLHIIDVSWVAHLQEMDYLKAGIGLRSYGHRDPLVEYKDEAHAAFAELTASIYEDLLRTVLRLPIEADEASMTIAEEDNPFNPDRMVYSNGETPAVLDNDSDIDAHNPFGRA
ncbi:MAG: preprotein translocase subunit SecA [Slackia sp.]|nr:preprotein translocase subunit SecA [Slackia sp.]